MQNAVENLSAAANSKLGMAAIHTAGAASLGAVATPKEHYTDFLTTNGWILSNNYLFSYSDLIKVIGAVYLLLLILQMIGLLKPIRSGFKWIFKEFIIPRVIRFIKQHKQ